MRKRLVGGLPCEPMEAREATQETVVGDQIVSRLMLYPLDFSLLQFRCNRAHYPSGQPILQIKYIVQRPFETIGPYVDARLRVNQLRHDAHTVLGLSHTAFQDVAHAEFATDLPDVDGSIPVREARRAGDHEQPF